MINLIYLDNAATTYPKPDIVVKALEEGIIKYSFNAGRGQYKEAKATYNMIKETRDKLGGLLNTSSDKVIFTSSATEALNNIIYGLINEGDEVFVSPFEHNAVVRTLYNIKAKITLIPFDKKTFILDENKYQDLLLLKRPKAIIISQVSNVTGFMLPYHKIFSLSHNLGCINVLDAAQSLGEYEVVKDSVDLVVFAGHKSLYATFGVAGFYNLTNVNLRNIKVGGTGSDSLNLSMPNTMPSKYEAGSLNSLAIYTLNKSLDFVLNNNIKEHKEKLTNYLIKRLKEIPNVIIYLPDNYISCGIVSFNLKPYKAFDIGQILGDEFNICVRTGYHCAPFIKDFLDLDEYDGTIRISLGYFNKLEEIDVLIDALKGMI